MSFFDQITVLQQDPFGNVKVAERSLEAFVSFHYPVSGGVNPEIVTAGSSGTGGAIATVAASMLTLTSGSTATTGYASMQSRNPVRYSPGQGIQVLGSAIFDPTANQVQEMGYGNASDGLFIGYNGTSFGINRRTSISGSVVDNWTAQASFTDGLPTGFDATKFNVYAIELQYLGAGEIDFAVEDNATGKMKVFHRIKYANLNSGMSFANPSLPLWARVINSGGAASSKNLKIGNMAAYVFGPQSHKGIRSAYRGSLAYTTSGEKAVYGIENPTTVFTSATNRSRMVFDHLSISTDGTKIFTVRFYRATLSSSGVVLDANGLAKYHTSPTTTGTNKLWFSIEMGKTDQQTIPFPGEIALNPGESLYITAESAANGDVAVGLSWEDLL